MECKAVIKEAQFCQENYATWTFVFPERVVKDQSLICRCKNCRETKDGVAWKNRLSSIELRTVLFFHVFPLNTSYPCPLPCWIPYSFCWTNIVLQWVFSWNSAKNLQEVDCQLKPFDFSIWLLQRRHANEHFTWNGQLTFLGTHERKNKTKG